MALQSPEIEQMHAGMQIEYVGFDAQSPVSVQIHQKELERLLEVDYQMTPAEIKRLHLRVLAPTVPQKEMDGPDKNTAYLGTAIKHSPDNKYDVINIHTGALLQEYYGWTNSIIETYFKNPTPENRHFVESQFSSKRVGSYLDKAPPERAREFLKKLASLGFGRKFSSIIAHEATHISQYNDEDRSKDSLNERQQITNLSLQILKASLVGGLFIALASPFLDRESLMKIVPYIMVGANFGFPIGKAIGKSITEDQLAETEAEAMENQLKKAGGLTEIADVKIDFNLLRQHPELFNLSPN